MLENSPQLFKSRGYSFDLTPGYVDKVEAGYGFVIHI